MKFLKFLLLSLIFNGLLQAAVANDQFPMSDKITMYFSTNVVSSTINSMRKQTENAASLVQELHTPGNESTTLRAAIIIAINNALFDKLTAENKKLSAIEKNDTVVVITPEIRSLLSQCVEILFSFSPKKDSTDVFIQMINGMIQKNQNTKKEEIFNALNSYFNIYENIIYAICSMNTPDPKTILDMQDKAESYVLKFLAKKVVNGEKTDAITQQESFVKRYLVAISQLIEQQQSKQLEEQIKVALKDYLSRDPVTLYFGTDHDPKNNLIKKLEEDNLRAQIISIINNILVLKKSNFSDIIQNGFHGTGKKAKRGAAFIKEITQKATKNDLLNQILNDKSLDIAALNDALTGDTRDALMPQVLDANKALSILERIVVFTYKELEGKSTRYEVVESLTNNQKQITELIIAQSGLGEFTIEVKTLIDKLSGFYFTNFVNKLTDEKQQLETQAVGDLELDVQAVDAAQVAETAKREEEERQAAEKAVAEEAKKQAEALAALDQAQKEEAKLPEAQVVSKKTPPTPTPRNNSQTQVLPQAQTQVQKPIAAPRPLKISAEILINLTTVLSVLNL